MIASQRRSHPSDNPAGRNAAHMLSEISVTDQIWFSSLLPFLLSLIALGRGP